jgi:iron complex transport system permease protein
MTSSPHSWAAEMPRRRGIVIDFRLARVLLGGVRRGRARRGRRLVSGGAAQPLADPFILGVSGGAALGAVIYIAFAPSSLLGGSIARRPRAFLGAVLTS